MQRDFWTLQGADRRARSGRPADRRGASRPVAQDLRAAVDRADAAACGDRGVRAWRARARSCFARCIGMALGFAYFVVDNFSLALGNVGAYPPFLAAWAPFLLFLLIGEAVLIRSEE